MRMEELGTKWVLNHPGASLNLNRNAVLIYSFGGTFKWGLLTGTLNHHVPLLTNAPHSYLVFVEDRIYVETI